MSITIKTFDSIPQGYSISLTLDHKTLVENNSSLPLGEDIKIFYDQTGNFSGNEKEIDIALDEESAWNSTNTKLWFKLQNSLPNDYTDNTHYRLSYNSSSDVSPLRNKNNVYYFYDDFNNGVLDGWEYDSNASPWSEQNGVLKSESNGAQIKHNLLNLSNYVVQVQIKKINANQYVGVLGRLLDFNKFYLFTRDSNAHDWRINRNINLWNVLSTNENFRSPIDDDRLTLHIVNNKIRGFINSQKLLEVEDDSLTEGTFGLFTNGENSATEFDNFIVRLLVEKEPEITLDSVMVTPESTLSLTIIPTPTLTITSTPTPTITPSPTPVDNEEIKLLFAETSDTDLNGKINQIKLFFNKDLNGTTVTNSDFSVLSYALSNTKVREENGTVTLFLNESNYYDTGTKPEITVKSFGIKDLNGNWNNELKIIAKDMAIPYLLINNDNIVTNDYLNISGVSSDFSSGEDGIVLLTKILYKKSNTTNWLEFSSIYNNEFLEPFEWTINQIWTETDDTIDFKIESYDLEGNIGIVYLNEVKMSTETPNNPDVFSTSHRIDQWSNNNIINFQIVPEDVSSAYSYYFSIITYREEETEYFKLLSNTDNFSSKGLTDGVYYLKFKTENMSGKTSEVSLLGPYKIDTKKPQGYLNYEKSSEAINFHFVANDELSGVKQVEVSLLDPRMDIKNLTILDDEPFNFKFNLDDFTIFGNYFFIFKVLDYSGNFQILNTIINNESIINVMQANIEQSKSLEDSYRPYTQITPKNISIIESKKTALTNNQTDSKVLGESIFENKANMSNVYMGILEKNKQLVTMIVVVSVSLGLMFMVWRFWR